MFDFWGVCKMRFFFSLCIINVLMLKFWKLFLYVYNRYKKIEFFLYFFYFNVGKKLNFLLLNINK